MIPIPMPSFILIRIEKKQQQERKEKIGSLYFPVEYTFMQRGLQNGEIVSIGETAQKEFPEAKPGHILIVHHFLEGKKNDKGYEQFLVHADEDYKYYVVTALDHNGQKNMTYGIWNGEKIITHKEYILLEKEQVKSEETEGDIYDKLTEKSSSGLFLFKQWRQTRADKEARLAELKNQVQSLSKSTMTEAVRKGIEEKELEMNNISKDINSKRYQPYKIAAFNPSLNEWFDTKIQHGEIIYMRNDACNTTVEILGKEYIIAKTDYIGLIYRGNSVAA